MKFAGKSKQGLPKEQHSQAFRFFRNEDCKRMKDWRSSLNADAEGASSLFLE